MLDREGFRGIRVDLEELREAPRDPENSRGLTKTHAASRKLTRPHENSRGLTKAHESVLRDGSVKVSGRESHDRARASS